MIGRHSSAIRAIIAIMMSALLFAQCGAAYAQASSPFVSVWQNIPQKRPLAKARLIAQKSANGQLSAGLELVLTDGAHTYWRTPGQVGVPPVFDFDGSQNIKDIKIDYPAPSLINEAGSLAYGYQGHVVWPINFQILDSQKPVDLVVLAQLAICANICVPAEVRLNLQLAPELPNGGANSDAGDLLTAARAQVPKILSKSDGRFDGLVTSNTSCGEASSNILPPPSPKILACWDMTLPTAFANPLAMFVEGTDTQWVFDAQLRPAAQRASIRLLQKPEENTKSQSAIPVTLTLTFATAPPVAVVLPLPAPAPNL